MICTTPLFYIRAPTCFGSSLPSSRGSFLDPSELPEIQIVWVVYHNVWLRGLCAGVSVYHNVWLRGLCAAVSWLRPLCFPAVYNFVLLNICYCTFLKTTYRVLNVLAALLDRHSLLKEK
jgi:hypothetical protein